MGDDRCCEKECIRECRDNCCRDNCCNDCCCDNGGGINIIWILVIVYLLFCNNNGKGGGLFGGLF